MRILKYLLLFVTATALCNDYYPTSAYVPVLMTRTEMERAVKLESARPLHDPGKIYYKSPYLFIVEKHKGVHVLDNSNPKNPENICFIHIDGVRDIAMKDQVMYADNAVDLIAIQLNSSCSSITVSKRFKNYFPEMTAPDGMGIPYYMMQSRPANSIVVNWKLNKTNQ